MINRKTIINLMDKVEENYSIDKNKEDRERAFIFLWDNLKEMLYKNDEEKI
jgi:hypothetical protein